MTAGSGVGRARREGRGATARGVAGGVGGDGGGDGCVMERSTALKVFESQHSLTYRVSPPWWLGGNGSLLPR